MKYIKDRPSYLIKENNIIRILDIIMKGNVSRADIAKSLGISRPAVSSNVNELLQCGAIIENGTIDSNGGRKGISLILNENYCFFVGIVLKKSSINIRFFDLTFKQRFKVTIPVNREEEPCQIIGIIEETIQKQADEHQLHDMAYMIISFPGIVKDNKVLLSNSLSYFNDHDIGQLFKTIPQNRFVIINDMTVKVRGMQEKYQHKNYNNIIYLSHELNGMGSGLLINGQVYEGARKGAGEVGLMYNFKSDLPVNKLSDYLVKYEDIIYQSRISAGVRNLDDWCNIILSDNTKLEQFAQYYSLIINNISHIIDPDVIILGGLLAKLGQSFYDRLMALLDQIAMIPINVIFSDADEEAEILGLKAYANVQIKEYILDKLRNT